jgi:hypothetical protein
MNVKRQARFATETSQSVFERKPVPDLLGDGHRFALGKRVKAKTWSSSSIATRVPARSSTRLILRNTVHCMLRIPAM